MKTLLKSLFVLLVCSFLLSLGNLTASAQSARTVSVYIPLVSPVSRSTEPPELQARRQYEALAPTFLAAQKQGQIIRFEPELAIGILKIEYKAGFDLSTLTRLPVSEDLAAAGEKFSSIMLTRRNEDSHDGSATAKPYFDADFNSGYVSGGNLGSFLHVQGSLRDPSGRVLSNFEAWTDSSGTFYSYFANGSSWEDIRPGYKITIKTYTRPGVLKSTFTSTVPGIYVSAYNIPATKLTGKGPANASLDFYLFHQLLDSTGGTNHISKTVTVSSAGAWAVIFGALRGNDYFYISYLQSTASMDFNYSTDDITVPGAYCELGGNYCGITGIPGKPASLSIMHGGVTYKYTGQFDAEGYYSGSLYDGYGNPIFLKAGDKVAGTGVTTLTLPTITAVPNATTNMVTGTAPASKYFGVDINIYNTVHWSLFNWTHSNSSGNYSADFSSVVDILPSDLLLVSVYYIDPSTGNYTYYSYSTGP